MNEQIDDGHKRDRPFVGLLCAAGFKYYTAPLLPAVLGTALPFWLESAKFNFVVLEAVLSIIAAVIFHAGFSLLPGDKSFTHIVEWI